jgi:hypothetical protein
MAMLRSTSPLPVSAATALVAVIIWSSGPTLAAGTMHGFALAQAEAPAAEQGAEPMAGAEAEPEPPIDPNAIAALERMGAALMALEQFGLTARITVEQVMDNGQKIQFGGTSTYAVRRPDRFKVQIVSDTASRDVYYDGKELVVSDPATGYFAGAEAKPTIKETIAWAEETLGIDMPLAGLFDWGTPDAPIDEIVEGFFVGPATVDGAAVEHWAFRGDDIDWEIWIGTGDAPLPRKLAITDRTHPSLPRYEEVLEWSPSESFADDAFVFTPGADAKPIVFAPLAGAAGGN